MSTQIFQTYSEFLSREDKSINGVSPSFAEDHADFEKQNETNEGCWNCSDCYGCSGCSRCSGCYGCSRCSRCSGCYGCSRCSRCYGCYGLEYQSDVKEQKSEPGEKIMGNYPVIENIHQKVYEAASRPDGLNMCDWHTCETTHCRAGWVVHLAGEAGRKLEAHTTTLFAALQIYNASSPIEVSPVRFFEDNATALADMKLCAEGEASLINK